MKSYYVFNRRGKLSKDGDAPLELCIYHNRTTREYFTTGIFLRIGQWDGSKIVKHPDFRELNARLNKFKQEKEREAEERMSMPERQYDTFNQFYEAMLENNVTLTDATKVSHRQTLYYLNDFARLKWDMLNHSFPDRFTTFLHRKGLAHNTIFKHHKNVRVYLNHAITYGQFTDSLMKWPYRTFKLTQKPGTKIALNETEIKKIEELELSGKANEVRDMFIFGCYTGLRFGDICSLQPEKQVEVIDDKIHLNVRMDKVDLDVHLPLGDLFAGKPQKIYEKYYNPSRAYLFPDMQNSTANLILKEIREKAKINKPLSFHASRHTFLTAIAAKTKDVFQVKRLGGITKTETAMIYIHLADDRFNESLKNVTW